MGNPSPHGPWTRRQSPRKAAWYPCPDGTTTTLEWLLANTRNPDNPLRLPRGGMAAVPPPARLPCEIVLTFARGSNGKTLHVRCRCMAGTAGEPSRRFYTYDALGQAGSLEEALVLWRGHKSAREAADGVE